MQSAAVLLKLLVVILTFWSWQLLGWEMRHFQKFCFSQTTTISSPRLIFIKRLTSPVFLWFTEVFPGTKQQIKLALVVEISVVCLFVCLFLCRFQNTFLFGDIKCKVSKKNVKGCYFLALRQGGVWRERQATARYKSAENCCWPVYSEQKIRTIRARTQRFAKVLIAWLKRLPLSVMGALGCGSPQPKPTW